MIGALVMIAQLAIVAHGPDSASTCEAFEVSVAVSARGSTVPRLIAPSFYPFDILRSSPVPHVSYDRGNGSVTAEYRYVLTTDRIGTYSLSPFEARLGKEVIRSRPVEIAVHSAGRAQIPAVVARARVDTSLAVDFRALSVPETVYVGQQANYEVAVFLNAAVRDRLRRNPTFFPPDMQSMLAYDLPARANPPRREGGSHCFDALVYQRALFPLMPGRFAIPPAQLVYSLPLSASFFSREETHDLETDSTIIVAVEPPMAGRPADFGGAVGNVRLATRLDTLASRVGDPIVLTVRVMGTGNVKLFPRPAVGVSWATLVKGDERVRVDTTARRIAGSKEFDWLLTPKVAGELDLPPIRYGYFNPETRRYEVASTGSTRVHVGPGSLASADTARTETLLPLRPRYRGAARTPMHEYAAFWALLALAPLPAFTLRRRSAKRPTTRSLQRAVAPTRRRGESRGEVARRVVGAARLHVGAERAPHARTRELHASRRTGQSASAPRRVHGHRDSSGALSPRARRGRLRRRRRASGRRGRARGAIVSRRRRRGAASHADFHAGDEHRCRRRAGRRGGARAHSGQRSAARVRRGGRGIRAPRVRRRARVVPRVGASGPPRAGRVGEPRHGRMGRRRHRAKRRGVATRAPPRAACSGRSRARRVGALAAVDRERIRPADSGRMDLHRGGRPLARDVGLGRGAGPARRRRSAHAARHRSASRLESSCCAGSLSSSAPPAATSTCCAPPHRSRSDPEIGGERGPTAIVGEVVREIGRQGAWTRVRLDDGRDGWIESASLISLDTRDASQIGN